MIVRSHGVSGLWRASPGEGGIDHAAFLHERRAVARVEGFVLVGVIEPVAEQFRAPAQLADQLLRIGIDHKLVRIEIDGRRPARTDRGRDSRRPVPGRAAGR